LNTTDPFPVPDAPDVIDSHDAFGVAVHAQVFALAVTVIVPPPPLAGTD
jgi:hypothetical protein